jgi:putative ABC transport system substrate-binding protein
MAQDRRDVKPAHGGDGMSMLNPGGSGPRAALAAVLAFSVLLAMPLAAEAQPARKVPRIGVLWGGATAFGRLYVEAAQRALSDLGYVEGKDFSVEYRFGERKPGAVQALAAELVQLKVDVIVAAGDPAIDAARRATTTIPIVMVAAGDPVRRGFVASLARPGGNITGMTFLSRELAGKRLELLKEAVPSASRVAVLWNPENPGGLLDVKATQAAAEILKMTARSVEVRTTGEFERAFKSMVEEQTQAVIVLTDPLTSTLAGKSIADLAIRDRLPIMCELREFTASGGLISYGPSLLVMAQRAATFVDKILKGAKPADLPVEQPTKFELVINLKTAKALGLKIPPSVLGRADQVIE